MIPVSANEVKAQLVRMDEFLQSLTSDLTLSSGSIFRLAYQYLQQWFDCYNGEKTLIPFDVSSIKDWIQSNAESSYMEEWQNTSEEINMAIARATERVGLGDGNDELNVALAKCIAKYYADSECTKVAVCDIGAGTGSTSVAIAHEISKLGFPEDLYQFTPVEFYLVEPSLERLLKAKNTFRDTFGNTSIFEYQFISATDSKQFSVLKDNSFDFVVSNAALHHKVFDEHFMEINRILRNGGLFILGDWYTNIWSHPAMIIPLLKKLGLGRSEIDKFRREFNLNEMEEDTRYSGMEESSKKAYKEMIDFEVAISEEVQKAQKDCEKEKRSCLYFIEGHETRFERVAKLGKSGFDIEDIVEIYPASGEFASVIAARKKDEKSFPKKPKKAAGKKRRAAVKI